MTVRRALFALLLLMLRGPAALVAAVPAVPAMSPPPAAAAPGTSPALAASAAPAVASPMPLPPECESALARLEGEVRADLESLQRGSDYRRAVIDCGAYDRAIAFFGELVAAHPRLPHLELNTAFAFVDKIPVAGSITRIILANTAIEHFTAAIEVEPSWLAVYSRGTSYLYWPKVFGRAPLAVADLERAAALAAAEPRRAYHVRGAIALGDAYWKVDEPEKARAAWQEGLRRFPGNAALEARLARTGEELAALVTAELDPDRRVDTDLSVLVGPP